MTRTLVFVGIVFSGAAYQAGKALLGFTPSTDTFAASVYWGGFALLLHWYTNRPQTETR